jgi:hypothetical protein
MTFRYATAEYSKGDQFPWVAHASRGNIFSGERRQLACGVRQLAEHDLLGKLPTRAGWQPALPRVFCVELYDSELINIDPTQKNRSGF